MPGATDPADLFTKEDNDVQHFHSLRDLMVKSREEFSQSQDSQWEMLKPRLGNIDGKNLTNSTPPV